MYAAMIPGNEIQIPKIVYPEICQKCHCRYYPFPGREARIDSEWCDSCNRDPLTDITEDDFWRREKKEPYIFMGWRFKVRETYECPETIVLGLYKKLPYPEDPEKLMSVSFGPRRELPKLAAWLIAHWFEHLLRICPCLHGERDQALDEGDGSPFRKAMIQSLLWYHSQGFSRSERR